MPDPALQQVLDSVGDHRGIVLHETLPSALKHIAGMCQCWGAQVSKHTLEESSALMKMQLSTSITRYAALSEEAEDNDDEDDIQKERRIKTVTQYLF